jgi:hypothetical protein
MSRPICPDLKMDISEIGISVLIYPDRYVHIYKWTYRKWVYWSIAISGGIGFRYIHFQYVHSYKWTYQKWAYWKPVVAKGIGKKRYILTDTPIFLYTTLFTRSRNPRCFLMLQ